MPKIKIDKFKGIYTNIDENDLSLDIFKDSCNISHEEGYSIFNNLPISESDLPELPDERWEWENGIYTTLTEDPFSKNNVGTTHDVLVLIAKFGSTPTERRVYLREDATWYELWKDGTNASSHINLDPDTFSTNISGKAFLKPDNGYLRLYLPHDSFWIGRLNREAWSPTREDVPHACEYLEYEDDWYIDRLVDKFDETNIKLKYLTSDVTTINSSVYNTAVTCATDRRIGILFDTDIREEETEYLNQEEITWVLYAHNYGDFVGWLYEAYREDGTLITAPYREGLDQTKWWFNQAEDPAVMAVHEAYHNVLTTLGVDPMTREDANWWSIGNAVFEAQTWYYAPGNQITDSGFKSNKTKYSIIVTTLLDEREEIVTYYNRYNISFRDSIDKYAIKIENIWLPSDINKRATRLRFYLKFEDIDSDYELYKEIDLLNEEEDPYSSFYLYETLRTGILLSQNIAYLFNEERPQDYRVVNGFRGLATINGITVALKSDSRSYVYHSIVGSGVLQTNMVLTTNKLLIPETSNLIAIADINNNIGIVSDKKVFMCSVGEAAGQLVFEIQDSVEHGATDLLDVVETQNSVFLHTQNGIFQTNGYEAKLVSEPINDIVKESHSNYNIVYNPYKHLLYYYSTNVKFYQYRMDYNKWESYKILPTHSGLRSILVTPNGTASFLFANTLWEVDETGTSLEDAYLITGNSDLGEMSVDKLLNFIDIDYSGECTVSIYFDDILQEVLLPGNSTERISRQVYFPLAKRHPFKKIYLDIDFETVGTKLYKLELDFSLLKRRYNVNA